MTIFNGTSEVPEAREANSALPPSSTPPYVPSPYRRLFRSACFPSGRAPSHPSRRPAERIPFSPRTIPRCPRRTRRRRPPRGSDAAMESRESSGIPRRRRVHPGHFADKRAIGDPRDTVSRVAPRFRITRDETRATRCATRESLRARIRCRENHLIITSLIPRRYFRPSRNNTRFPITARRSSPDRFPSSAISALPSFLPSFFFSRSLYLSFFLTLTPFHFLRV